MESGSVLQLSTFCWSRISGHDETLFSQIALWLSDTCDSISILGRNSEYSDPPDPKMNLQPNIPISIQPMSCFCSTRIAEWNWKFSKDEICWFITWGDVGFAASFLEENDEFHVDLKLDTATSEACPKKLSESFAQNRPNANKTFKHHHLSVVLVSSFFPNHLNPPNGQDTTELVGLSSTKSGGSTKDRDPPTKFMRLEIIAFHMQVTGPRWNSHVTSGCFKHKGLVWDWYIYTYKYICNHNYINLHLHKERGLKHMHHIFLISWCICVLCYYVSYLQNIT